MHLLAVMGLTMVLSCTEDLGGTFNNDSSSNHLTFCINTENEISTRTNNRSLTRGTKTNTSSLNDGFGVSCSVYPSSGTYTDYAHGSYFYKLMATPNTPTPYYWPTSDYKLSFFAYYPYGNAAFTVQSAASDLGAPTYAYTVPSAIGSQLDVMTGQTTNVLGGGSSPVLLTMKHRCAAINFSVTNNRSSDITINSISIEGVKYSGTLNEETWTLNAAVNSSSSNPFALTYGNTVAVGATTNVTGTSNIFLMLPQTIPAGAKIKVAVNGEEFEAELTGTWVAGKQYNYSLEIKNNIIIVVDEDTEIEDWEEHVIDLSMVDNAGNNRVSMTTANCYLVHEAGKYKLPLVYGNAIKNGEDNLVAYYPGKDGTIANGTDRFVNHNNNGITAPWITKPTSGTGINKGMSITVNEAELLWQDVSGLITDVSINGDYLKFTVGTFNPGNAVIAVKSGSDIVWSWHIWATDDDLSNTTIVSTDLHDYTVSPVNLGWVPTGGDGKQGRSPYYQWGRKDPFIPATDNVSGGNATVYNIGNTVITPETITSTSTGIQYEENNSATIADNIKNPIKFYYNSTNNGTCTTSYYNMWDAQNSATGNVASATKKTIYDPCPPNFCVPTGNLLYYIGNGGTMSTWDSTNNGATWNTGTTGDDLWFPASGCRFRGNANTSNVNTHGYYWSATPFDNMSHYIFFYSGLWNWGFYPRSFGFSIRPVAEE